MLARVTESITPALAGLPAVGSVGPPGFYHW